MNKQTKKKPIIQKKNILLPTTITYRHLYHSITMNTFSGATIYQSHANETSPHATQKLKQSWIHVNNQKLRNEMTKSLVADWNKKQNKTKITVDACVSWICLFMKSLCWICDNRAETIVLQLFARYGGHGENGCIAYQFIEYRWT